MLWSVNLPWFYILGGGGGLSPAISQSLSYLARVWQVATWRCTDGIDSNGNFNRVSANMSCACAYQVVQTLTDRDKCFFALYGMVRICSANVALTRKCPEMIDLCLLKFYFLEVNFSTTKNDKFFCYTPHPLGEAGSVTLHRRENVAKWRTSACSSHAVEHQYA